jgi:hypothetical protein
VDNGMAIVAGTGAAWYENRRVDVMVLGRVK